MNTTMEYYITSLVMIFGPILLILVYGLYKQFFGKVKK